MRQDIRKLLSEMNNQHSDKDKLAELFRVGDERITDIIQALDDPDPAISLHAQIVIRYLGNNIGMRGLVEWYGRQKQFAVVGPIPLPLSEWDYKVIYANYVSKPMETWNGAEPYIYALALDGSPKAEAALNEIKNRAGNYDKSATAGRALVHIQRVESKKLLTGSHDLAKLILNNAFFIAPDDRKYTSAQLVGFSSAEDKALVEVYINRGRLAEEWYHIVVRRWGQGWKFFSITQIAVS